VVGAGAAPTGQYASVGEGWTSQWSATDFTLYDVSFADAQHGWAVGGNGSGDGSVGIILATADGGATWTVQDAGGGFPMLTAVYAIDAQTCCAVGGNPITNDSPGVVLITRDGGATWTVQASDHMLRDVMFVDALNGWCVGEYVSSSGLCSGVVLATDDGGMTWAAHEHTDVGFMEGVSFVDAMTGWVITDIPHGEPDPSTVRAYKTGDGGATMEKVFETKGVFSAICFVDDLHGWVAGAEIPGVGPATAIGVWATGDGGKTWTLHECGGAEYLYGVCFIDALHGWVVGNGIYSTNDGGQTWTQQLLGDGASLFGVDFIDATRGIVVGTSGSVLSTSDGGVGDGTPQSLSGGGVAGPGSSKAEMRAYLKRLQQLITQARRGRQKLRDAVYGFEGGRLSGHAAANKMRTVIDNRSSVLNQVRGIAVPDNDDARRCRATLVASMRASLGADACYLAWMEGAGSVGAASPYDQRAGSAKGRFVRTYNALAAQYGMRSNWQVKDL